jgi:hypothetical protein
MIALVDDAVERERVPELGSAPPPGVVAVGDDHDRS